MEQWRLYSSNILYGIFSRRGKQVYVKSLDFFNGRLGEEVPFSEQENARYRQISMLDIGLFFERLEDYEQLFSGEGKEEIHTSFGERYTRRNKTQYAQRDVKFPRDILVVNKTLAGVLCPNREAAWILIKDGFLDYTVLKEWRAYDGGEWRPFPVRYAGMFEVMTRDHIALSTDVYLPAGVEGKIPAMLVRTPYGKDLRPEVYFRYVQRGYAVIIQDVRGRNLSGGEFLPNYYEVQDGDDTLNWIAAQPFSNQKIGMTGGSYLGYVQWAAAASNNPYLCAILSVVCAGGAFTDVPRRGGCFTSGMLAWAFAVSEKKFNPELMVRDDWDQVLNIRPLSQVAAKALGYEIPFLNKWLEHKDCDEFWKRSDWQALSEQTKNLRVIPALIMSGWFDDNGMGTTQALELTREYPKGSRKVLLGPWMHSANTTYDIHGIPMGMEAVRYDIDFLFFQWIDHYLKGRENGIEKTAPVEYYTLGQNCWKQAQKWPVETAKDKIFYLGRDQKLLEKPEVTGKDSYLYDPENPAVHLVDMSENELEVPEDYTQEEKRRDVLTYSTREFQEDMTVTGDIQVNLFVSSDAPDTDFFVRITDVDENGRSIKLADGMLCARYRKGFEKPVFMEKGQVYPLQIKTTKISNTFFKGHRLRLTVTSSAQNFIFPNSNTREGFDSTVSVAAVNSIHYGEDYPAYIKLLTEQ